MPGTVQVAPRILIAEPDGKTRALYREAFANTGCDVIEAVDGREALIKALVRRPSLAIVELQLPELDGIMLCTTFRQDRTTADVPIIVVTAAGAGERRRARQAGADIVLSKPFAMEQLLLSARRLLMKSSDLRGRSSTARDRAAEQLDRTARGMVSPPSARTRRHR